MAVVRVVREGLDLVSVVVIVDLVVGECAVGFVGESTCSRLKAVCQ